MAMAGACRSLLRRIPTLPPLTRSLKTGMRRSALREALLRHLRTEIASQSGHLRPSPLAPRFGSFSLDPRLGEGCVRLTRSDDREEISVDASVVDGAAPATRSGASSEDADARLHITLAVEVSKKGSGPGGAAMRFICSAWPDAMDVDRVFACPRGLPDAIDPYLGPQFKNLDGEMQKAVHDYLEERGINDDLAAFLHNYMSTKDRIEHIRWLTNVETYVKK